MFTCCRVFGASPGDVYSAAGGPTFGYNQAKHAGREGSQTDCGSQAENEHHWSQGYQIDEAHVPKEEHHVGVLIVAQHLLDGDSVASVEGSRHQAQHVSCYAVRSGDVIPVPKAEDAGTCTSDRQHCLEPALGALTVHRPLCPATSNLYGGMLHSKMRESANHVFCWTHLPYKPGLKPACGPQTSLVVVPKTAHM